MEQPRKIKQDKIKGNIYLHSMPGKNEKLDEIMDELKKLNVTRIFCLTGKEEIERKAPEYLQAVYYGHYDGIYITYNPSPDDGLPQDLVNYDRAVHQAYNTLKNGNILIHCKGGVGRTGTFTTILLRKIGYTFKEALKMTKEAGAKPGVPDQQDFCKHYNI